MTFFNVQDVHGYYGEVQAVAGVDVHLEQGEFATILGSNGVGKSTLLKMIAGLVPCRTGSVTFDGERISSLRPDAIVQRGISLVPEGRQVFGPMTVLENLELGAFLRYGKHAKLEIQRSMDFVFDLFPSLRDRRHEPAGTLSGGMQQMLAIGRGLMSEPRLLLLDEPSLGLAPKVAQSIFTTLRDLNRQGVTILLVEQNAGLALEIAGRAYVMRLGKIAGEDSSENLLKGDLLKNLYLGVI